MDLGMHKGDFAKVICGRYGCSVVGVEANPALASRLLGLDGLSCKNAAISAADGSVKFAITENDLQASRIVPESTPLSLTVVVVPSISLATFFHEVDATQLELLKIDIEGAELDIIERTDPKIFQRCKQITIEFHSFLYPADRERVERAISLLSTFGFWHIDFSITRSDVLFINNNLIDVPRLAKMLLITQKYHTGVSRRLRRWSGDKTVDIE
jgi:FkbM family methyltransferase